MNNSNLIIKLFNESDVFKEIIAPNVELYAGVKRNKFLKMTDEEKVAEINDISPSTMLSPSIILLQFKLNIFSSNTEILDPVLDNIIDIVERYNSSVGGSCYKDKTGVLCFSYMLEIDMSVNYRNVISDILNYLKGLDFRYQLKLTNKTPFFNPLLAHASDKDLEDEKYLHMIKCVNSKKGISDESYTYISESTCIPVDNLRLLIEKSPKDIVGSFK